MAQTGQQQTPEIGMPFSSFYDGRLGGEINKTRYQIINSYPHKAPYFQNSFEDELAINHNLKGSNEYRYMSKRKGFTSLADYPDYEIVDAETIGDTVFYLAIKNDRTQIKLLKQVGLSLIDVTQNNNVITDFSYYYGLSEKLVKSFFPGGEPRKIYGNVRLSSTGYMNYSELHGYFLEDENVTGEGGTKRSTDIQPGDFIYIYESGVGGSGDVGVITSIINDNSGDNKAMLKINGVWNINVNSPKTGAVKYIIFPSLVETLMFVTANGVVQYHYDGYILPAGALYGSKGLQITSLNIHKENLYALDYNSGRVYYGSYGYKKNFIKAFNYIEIGKKYRWLYTFQDYLLLLGKNDIGGISQQLDNTGKEIITFLEFVNGVGVWNEEAYKDYLGGFYLIGSDGNFYSLSLIVNYFAKPQVKLEPQSYWVPDQLRTSHRDKGQRIKMEVTSNGVAIYINNYPYPTPSNKNTKILFFDNFYRFWYSWMVSGITINGRIGEYRYGSKLYTNTGDTDDGNEIRQIFVGIFGQETPTVEKFLTTSKILLGQNTKISEGNTVIRLKLNHQGRSRIINNAYMYNTEYVELVNKKVGGHINQPLLNMPDGTVIKDGNFNVTMHTIFEKEFEYYNNYIQAPVESTYIDPYEEMISKYGILEWGLAQHADSVVYEIICLNKDQIEFGGVVIGYVLTDPDITRLDNVMSVDITK